MAINKIRQTAVFALPLLMLMGAAIAPAHSESTLESTNNKLFTLAAALQANTAKSQVLEDGASAQTKQNATSTATILGQSDTLGSGDETLDDGSFFDVHYFTGRAGQDVTIYLESNEFDTYLMVFGPDGEKIVEVDDFDETTTNAAASITLPTNGDYAVVATSYSPGETGSYQVTVNTTLGTGDLQATLSWDSQDDLDLFVMDPNEEVVTFSTPTIESGGQLDVDANSQCRQSTNSPVENVYWPQGQAPSGEYRIGVSLYDRCTNTTESIPFTLTLRVQGSVETFTGVVDENNDLVVYSTAVYR
ncbi:MAG: pre-peptidase C-terminal domain-containing protein [Cyanobacteria bacterium P01_A01_bin.123]